ncbi:hypothetical protein PMI17_03353 [Pantoea sp. GM01]|nr:hypothetical protein PMI17_03353 [Pantoea sp. GM01]
MNDAPIKPMIVGSPFMATWETHWLDLSCITRD